MNILILGGAGFLGSHLALRLAEKHQITVIDNLDPRFMSSIDWMDDRIKFLKLDVRDTFLYGVEAAQSDVVICLFGQTSHPLSMTNPQFDNEMNCVAHLYFLQLMSRIGSGQQVIYISSSTVYGPCDEVIDESTPTRPADFYSAHKLAAENYYRLYGQTGRIRPLVLRLSNVYGSRGKNSPAFGVVNFFIQQALRGNDLSVFGSGEQRRNLLNVNDVVSALERAIEIELVGGPYIVAGLNHFSIKQIADNISHVFNVAVRSVPWPAGRKEIDVGDVYLISSKFRSHTGWIDTCGFVDGLKEIRNARVD